MEWKSTEKARCCPSYGDIRQIAGFLEGEGAFTRTSNDSQMVQVTNCDLDTLIMLLYHLGGKIIMTAEAKGNHRRKFMYYACGSRARGIMLTMFQFLTDRRRLQIKKALMAKHKDKT